MISAGLVRSLCERHFGRLMWLPGTMLVELNSDAESGPQVENLEGWAVRIGPRFTLKPGP